MLYEFCSPQPESLTHLTASLTLFKRYQGMVSGALEEH